MSSSAMTHRLRTRARARVPICNTSLPPRALGRARHTRRPSPPPRLLSIARAFNAGVSKSLSCSRWTEYDSVSTSRVDVFRERGHGEVFETRIVSTEQYPSGEHVLSGFFPLRVYRTISIKNTTCAFYGLFALCGF